jgi:hypothetical protein
LVTIIELLPGDRERTTARMAEVRNTARFIVLSVARRGRITEDATLDHRLTVAIITNKLSIRARRLVFVSPHGQNELHTDRVDDPNHALGYGFSNNVKRSCR